MTQSAAPPVGGWLLVLCVLLLVGQPLSLALIASEAIHALPIRGLPLALLLAVRLVAAGLGIAAGIAIMRRTSLAPSLAKTALIVSAAVDVLYYVTPYAPNHRMPGDTPLFIAASLAYYTVWLAYLARSRRVKSFFES